MRDKVINRCCNFILNPFLSPSPKKGVKRLNSEVKWNGYGKEIGQEERIDREDKISLNFRKCAANLSKNEGMTV